MNEEKQALTDFIKSVKTKDAASAKKHLAKAVEIKLLNKKNKILKEL
jgi:hypothetical protein